MDLRLLRYFVAVAEELHFGRAAVRLQMTQPPLSRAIKQLEADIGAVLLVRTPAGVTLTDAGVALHDEARTLLAQAEQVRTRVVAAAGNATITLGTLADSAEQTGTQLVAAFRRRHPQVRIDVREADLTDPTTGLRSGLVDVALTRAPFDTTGIATRVLRSDAVSVVLRVDDPLAGRTLLYLADLDERSWFRLPDGTDPVWQAYWNGTPSSDNSGRALSDRPRPGPIVRTAQECLQAVLWNGSVGLTPPTHALPDGLVSIPLADMPPSQLVVAWNVGDPNPLVASFAQIAVTSLSPGGAIGNGLPRGAR